jgi:hypothetical protein
MQKKLPHLHAKAIDKNDGQSASSLTVGRHQAKDIDCIAGDRA